MSFTYVFMFAPGDFVISKAAYTGTIDTCGMDTTGRFYVLKDRSNAHGHVLNGPKVMPAIDVEENFKLVDTTQKVDSCLKP